MTRDEIERHRAGIEVDEHNRLVEKYRAELKVLPGSRAIVAVTRVLIEMAKDHGRSKEDFLRWAGDMWDLGDFPS